MNIKRVLVYEDGKGLSVRTIVLSIAGKKKGG
jgi:hypothetical protein